jgi:Uma2 family endonuclease
MSAAEFLALDAPATAGWQLVDGQPRAMVPASRTHGAVRAELGRLIGNHLAARGGACSVVTSPGIVPRVHARHNVRYPDLAVTCVGYQAEEQTVSDPVLIVEMLSPTNAAQTWANVWTYTTIPSVHEVLVVHTAAMAAELLRRLPDGTWPQEPQSLDAAATLRLESIALDLPLAALYRTTRLVLAG